MDNRRWLDAGCLGRGGVGQAKSLDTSGRGPIVNTFRLTFFAGVLLVTSTSHARLIRTWTYDDLVKESDLVVIANVVDAKVVPTTEDLSVNGLATFGHPFQQIETAIRVRAVIKGKYEQKRLDMVHFRYDPKDTHPTINPPTLIEFPKSDRIARTIGEGNERVYGKDYLLFLKVGKDGKYRPVTGQVDPLFSVREVGNALHLILGEPRK